MNHIVFLKSPGLLGAFFSYWLPPFEPNNRGKTAPNKVDKISDRNPPVCKIFLFFLLLMVCEAICLNCCLWRPSFLTKPLFSSRLPVKLFKIISEMAVIRRLSPYFMIDFLSPGFAVWRTRSRCSHFLMDFILLLTCSIPSQNILYWFSVNHIRITVEKCWGNWIEYVTEVAGAFWGILV